MLHHPHLRVLIASYGTLQPQMTQQTKTMTTSLWTSVGIMLAVLGLFMLTYITIRLLPSPHPRRRTCRSPDPVQLVQPPLQSPDKMFAYYLLDSNTPGEELQAKHRDVMDTKTCLEASCHIEMTDQSLVQEESATEIMVNSGLGGHDAVVVSSSSVDEQMMVVFDGARSSAEVYPTDCEQQGLCFDDNNAKTAIEPEGELSADNIA